MKSDLTNWLLTLILAVFAVACVILSLQTIFLTREFRSLSLQASIANNSLLQVRSLANDASLFNQKSPTRNSRRFSRLFRPPRRPLKPFSTAMNEPQINAETSEQIAALRLQLFIALLGLVLVSASLAGYLYLQQRFTRRDIAAIRPQAQLVVQILTRIARPSPTLSSNSSTTARRTRIFSSRS